MNPMGVFGIGLYPSDSRITRKRCGTPLDLEKKHLKQLGPRVFWYEVDIFGDVAIWTGKVIICPSHPVDAKSELFHQGNVITLDLWQALQPLACTYPIHDMTFSAVHFRGSKGRENHVLQIQVMFHLFSPWLGMGRWWTVMDSGSPADPSPAPSCGTMRGMDDALPLVPQASGLVLTDCLI